MIECFHSSSPFLGHKCAKFYNVNWMSRKSHICGNLNAKFVFRRVKYQLKCIKLADLQPSSFLRNAGVSIFFKLLFNLRSYVNCSREECCNFETIVAVVMLFKFN